MSVKISYRRLINRLLRHNSFYQELKIWREEKKRFLKDAETILREDAISEQTLIEYKKALRKHRVTFNEYMYSFEFWKLNESQRDEFVSCSEMQCIYRKIITSDIRASFFNKESFLNKFSKFVYRDWLSVKNASYDSFSSMLYQYDCVAKPLNGTRGKGIFLIEKKRSGEDVSEIFHKCQRQNILLEQRIRCHPAIEAFHPGSLNTIRVVTISNSENCCIFGAVLRMGVKGSFIDNTHSGGIFASIDINLGIVDSDGIDSKGNHYVKHPDSGIMIKGFHIPHWDNVISVCKEASHIIPGTVFAGWDLCILEDGRIELIEGNHAPDFDGGMQAPHKIGVKKRMRTEVLKLTGIDPIKLIPVYSKTYNKYRFFN